MTNQEVFDALPENIKNMFCGDLGAAMALAGLPVFSRERLGETLASLLDDVRNGDTNPLTGPQKVAYVCTVWRCCISVAERRVRL